jgi:hypothetical protein
MPRESKRPKQIKISVSIELYDDLFRMSEFNEMSLSACVADMLEALHPGIKHTLKMLEQSHKLDAKAKNNLAKSLERHEQHLRQAVKYVQQNSEEDIKQHKLPL